MKEVGLCLAMGLCLVLAVLATAWFISETNEDQTLIGRDLRDRQ
jgi:hypothetical protein